MQVLIIDNEKSIRETLKAALKAFCPQVETIDEASNIESGLQKIKTFKPDLLLLDIELDEGTGIDLLNLLGNSIDFSVVFVTAHSKYAIDAFKHSAIDFLLKPINPEELVKCIHKADNNKQNATLLKQLNLLQEQFSQKLNTEKKITLREQNSIHVIKTTNIIYCFSEGNYTSVFTINPTKKIVISKNMKYFEELLTDFGFLRIHNSYIVNCEKIEKYDKGDGGFVFIHGGVKIPVSQRKKEAFITLLNKINPTT
jgi:two-component system LytT family response regulator